METKYEVEGEQVKITETNPSVTFLDYNGLKERLLIEKVSCEKRIEKINENLAQLEELKTNNPQIDIIKCSSK